MDDTFYNVEAGISRKKVLNKLGISNNILSSNKIEHRFYKNKICLERVEAIGNKATVYRRNSSIVLRRFNLDFTIINAFYVKFTPTNPEDYLCLIGENRINFYAIVDDQFCSLALPFKICAAHLFTFGLLLERDCFSDIIPTSFDSAQVYSLTHPYNEIFPVLCKFKEDSQCYYAFSQRRIYLISNSKDNELSFVWNKENEIVNGYDIEKQQISSFKIRKCSKEERKAAKNAQNINITTGGPFNFTLNTPVSMQSFYSPNFFSKKFQAQNSTLANNTSVTTGLNSTHSPFYNASQVTPNALSASANKTHSLTTMNRITPLRHSMRTRSMAAAVHNESLAFANSMSNVSSLGDKTLHRSVQRATTNSARINLLNFITPTRAPFDTESLLSFGGEEANVEATSLDSPVEFCLEWISDTDLENEANQRQRLKDESEQHATEPLLKKQKLELLDDILQDNLKRKLSSLIISNKKENGPLIDVYKKWNSLKWGDNRLCNITRMLDSSKPILIPNIPFNDAESGERERREEFLLKTAAKTVTRPFGQALLSFRTEKPSPNDPWLVKPICLNGRVNPGRQQVDYPNPESQSTYKQMLEWASFYNGIAHGLAVLGYGYMAEKSNIKSRKIGQRIKQSRLLSSVTANFSSTPAPTHLSYNELYSGNLTRSVAQTHIDLNDSSNLPEPAQLSTDLFTTPRGIPQIRREQRNQFSNNTQMDTEAVVFDWDWLCMNLKAHQELLPVQAGFLLAAGLTGHIRSINLYDIHEFLTKNEKFLAIAVMMGLSVAHRGTSNVNVYKILTTHLPFLLPPTLCEFRIDPSIQTSSIISLGFLFAETANYGLVNKLINQMAREVFDNDQTAERYSNVLAAGFAVGLINLGKGKEIDAMDIPIATPHLSPKERLVVLLNGGKRELCLVNYDRTNCSSNKMFTTGFANTYSANSQFNEANSESLNQQRSGQAINAGDGLRAGGSSSRHVRELKAVNIHVTSPAACVALTLMFLKTEDKWITSKMDIPNTICEIERIRPDVLMMRVLGKSLINFDQIGLNKKWLEKQCPKLIMDYTNEFIKKKDRRWTWYMDLETVAQTYYYCMAGACFAIGMRYASTCNLEAHLTIMDLLTEIEDSFKKSWSLIAKAGENCYFTLINVCATALAMIMGGSGDLKTTQYLRKLRNLNRPKVFSMIAKEIDAHVHSLHITINMALGLLYLGHSRLSLSKSSIGLAGLLIAFFPLYPAWLGDNRLYFQPLRFLWTLAVDSHEVRPPNRKNCSN